MQSASLVLANTPSPNAINRGTPEIIQPANLIQPQNQTDPLTWGTYYDIGSNLTVYITLGNTAPTQALDELLLLAREQVHERAALFGPTTPVPFREKKSEMRQTVHAGLTYFIEPGRAFVPRRPGLQWGEFEIVTSWLYEHREVSLNHRGCTFLLFKKLSMTTGQQANLAFGAIKPLETPVAVDTTSKGTARLPLESVSQSRVDTS